MADPTKDLPMNRQLSKTGQGGEWHQQAGPGDVALTTAQGVVIADNQNSLTVGSPGPLLMQDFILREKIFHFDHERIPERVVQLVAPQMGGFTDSDGVLHPAHHCMDAGKSVLFDAVAVLLGPGEAGLVASMPAAQDFLRDAHAHCNFVGLAGAEGLVNACGLSRLMDGGYHA